MKTDFEQRLQSQPLRPVPPEWRGDILSAARAAVPHPGPAAGAPIRRLLSEWLWPHPVAWAGLAASWALVAVLNTAAGGPVLAAFRPTPLSASALAVEVRGTEPGADVPVHRAPTGVREPSPALPTRLPGSSSIERHEIDLV